MSYERMFRVIVLGGVTLVAGTACGSTATGTGDAAGDTGADTFPQEGPPPVDVQPIDATDGFPQEGPDVSPPDVGPPDVFPQEGPVILDAGSPVDVAPEASPDAGGCFPQETAIAQDC